MKSVPEIEVELKRLIIDTLMLEDVSPQDIESDAPLFGEGLGLDSIDALELSMAISKHYEVEMGSDQDQNREIYRSVRTLSEHLSSLLTPEDSES